MKISSPLDVSALVGKFLLASAVLVGCCHGNAQAQGVLAYSFEDGLQGFGANGPGILPLTQSTTGATEGAHSLKMELLQSATYVGALTGELDPNIIGDPPGLFSMTFDLTLESAFPEEGFVDLFVVFFGLQQGTAEPGLEVSFQFDETNRVGVGDLEPGTHPIKMQFNSAFHPLDFENFDPRPFNDIFGAEGSGNPIDLIPVGFQLTVNKSTQAPWVGYVDNIRFSATAGTPGDFDGDGDVDGRDFLVWQRGGTTPALDPELLSAWQTNYGGSNPVAMAAIPEPASAAILLSCILGTIATMRGGRSVR